MLSGARRSGLPAGCPQNAGPVSPKRTYAAGDRAGHSERLMTVAAMLDADYRRILDAMQMGVTIRDPQGRIVYCNPAEAALHGYQVDELVGQSSSQVSQRSRCPLPQRSGGPVLVASSCPASVPSGLPIAPEDEHP